MLTQPDILPCRGVARGRRPCPQLSDEWNIYGKTGLVGTLCAFFSKEVFCGLWASNTVKLLLNAGSQINAGRSDVRVLINAGSRTNAGLRYRSGVSCMLRQNRYAMGPHKATHKSFKTFLRTTRFDFVFDFSR